RPVARGAGAVFLAGNDNQRRAVVAVLHGRVIDRHDFLVGEVGGETAFGAFGNLVFDAHVGEVAAHHDFMVAAARAVGVEVGRLNALVLQVAAGRGVRLDRAGRGDVVGRDRIAQLGQHARAGDVADRLGFHAHAFEEGRVAHVGRVFIPLEHLAGGRVHAVPQLVALEHALVILREHLGGDVFADEVLDLVGVGPDVLQIH